jgi:hypothetical protein
LFGGVANADYSAAEQIARNTTLEGYFDYFLENWANPGCGLTLTGGSTDKNQEALNQITKSIAAGRCHGPPPKRQALGGDGLLLTVIRARAVFEQRLSPSTGSTRRATRISAQWDFSEDSYPLV